MASEPKGGAADRLPATSNKFGQDAKDGRTTQDTDRIQKYKARVTGQNQLEAKGPEQTPGGHILETKGEKWGVIAIFISVMFIIIGSVIYAAYG